MTEREAIERIQNDLKLHHDDLSGQYRKVLRLAISALKKQEADRWHSVAKEGNPKESNNYLVTLKKGKVMEDFYHVPDNEWSTASRIGCGIAAWRPLPEPYTEEES